ncbi:MAG: hypothetical protein E7299_00235 [Lachnospiraceae bacterium]|nr:hypothetical protein [Lachnospiraceae bacterium]
MKEQKGRKKLQLYMQKLDGFICRMDRWSLIWAIIPLMVVFFSYYFMLGKNCVIETNDQLDETLFTYVLNAKYMFSEVDVFPEMLGGVPRGGVTVSAWIFVPLYRIFSTYHAFMIQFMFVAATAFIGMYLLVKELTDSSIIALICGGLFMFLPYQPVYGLSLVGGPLVFWAFLCLYRQKHIMGAFLSIVYFGLAANLVLLGYVVLGFVALVLVFMLINWHRSDKYQVPEKKDDVACRNKLVLCGFGALLLVYVITNASLFWELFVGSSYISHREEMVVSGTGFASAWDVFLHSAQHAPTYHEKLIIPILLIIIGYGVFYRKLKAECKQLYIWLVVLFFINVGVALFYGFCQSPIVVDFRNSVSGFLHYFSAYRVYWIYPTTWYTMTGLAAGLVWKCHGLNKIDTAKIDTIECQSGGKKNGNIQLPATLIGCLITLVIIPTTWDIYQNSNWILNRSQYNNHCNVGLKSWNDYLAEDVMTLIKEDIQEKTGKTQSEYKVASLGLCPAVALHSGFYCIDGYSNNYKLDYKHEFREIIEKELEKCDNMRLYYDTWGSRCYLFTEESQNFYYFEKDADFQYQNLELNTDKMEEMGCNYLFSGAEIEESNAEELGLELFGVYDTPQSYYRVWVYEV